MGKAGAQIEITASSSRLVAGLSAAHAKFTSFAGSVARGMGRAFKSINAKLQPGATAKSAMGNFGGDMLGRGMDAVVDAASDVRNFESELQRLGVSSQQTPAQMDALARSMERTSATTAVSRDELMKAASTYFDLTSDVKGTEAALQTFAKTAQASGADMESLVKTSAAMGDSMGISSTEFESTFSGLIKQGEAGKVTLRELAGEAPSLMAMFAKFGKGRQGVMEMNAAFQVGAKAFGSASQAATGLEAMMGMLQARQKQLGAAGVQVYQKNKDGTVTLRNLSKIIDDIRNKKIDPRKYGKIFGENKEGRSFMEKLLEMPELYKNIVAAGEEAGAVQEYAMKRSESRAGRLDLAFNNIKLSIAEAFTPERIEAFTRGVEALAQKLGPVLDIVGKVGDVLGGLNGVGKSIRGAIQGETNPFRQSKGGLLGNGPMGAITGAAQIADVSYMFDRKEIARRRQEERKAETFAKARDQIMGAEVNDRTSKGSIRAAYSAASSDPNANGYAGLGTVAAGDQYLRAAGLTREKAGEQITKDLIAQLEKQNADLIEAIKANGTVQIGDTQIARSADKSTDARRSPQ